MTFSGANASGKTSLLEAIYMLCSGRSFRTRRGTQLINHDADSFLVRAAASRVVESDTNDQTEAKLATQLTRKESPRFRMNAEDIRPSQLARSFPTQIIDAAVFDLVGGSPSHRRRFVDWGMFHVKHEFYPLWRQHRKIASHWNALLRQQRPVSEFESWKPSFIDMTERLAAMRAEYLTELVSVFQASAEEQGAKELFGGDISLSLSRGWPEGIGYAEHLDATLMRDMRDRRLKTGPQFFDLNISIDNKSAREILSRGQMKLLGLKLKLAQIKMYNSAPNRSSCVVLVDDLAAEVDLKNQKQALAEILAAGSQVFMTTVDQAQLRDILPEAVEMKMFHVKHGELTELN